MLSVVDSLDGVSLEAEFEIDEDDDLDTVFSSDEDEDIPEINEDSVIASAFAEVNPAHVDRHLIAERSRPEYLRHLKHRLSAFMDYFTAQEGHSGVLKGLGEDTSLSHMIYTILFTTDRRILSGVMHGDLPRRRRLRPNRRLRRALALHKQRAKVNGQPVIYANFLVDRQSGHPPTFAQMELILSDFKTYVTTQQADNKFANAVDNAFPGGNFPQEASNLGQRRYLGGALSKCNPRPLQEVCMMLEKRLREASNKPGYDKDQPMPTAMCEVGFTSDATTRLRTHREHSSSNDLLNLAEAICRLRADAFGKTYSMDSFIIYCIPYRPLIPVSEHFFSVVGHAYTYTGNGFNSIDAGLSTHALINDEELDNSRAWVEGHIDLESNKAVFQRGDKQYVKSADNVETQIAVEHRLLADLQDEVEEGGNRIRQLATETDNEELQELLAELESLEADMGIKRRVREESVQL